MVKGGDIRRADVSFHGGVVSECGERAWCSCSTLLRETDGADEDLSSDLQCLEGEATKLFFRVSCTSLHRFRRSGGFYGRVTTNIGGGVVTGSHAHEASPDSSRRGRYRLCSRTMR